jgi:hypothetical protein
MYSELITTICEQLQRVPALKYIGQNWGQLAFFLPNQPVQWPCALVDATNASYTNIGRQGQQAQLTIRVIIATQQLTNNSVQAPLMQRQLASEIYNVLEAAAAALHGFTSLNYCTALIRTATQKNDRDDGIQQYTVLYTCTVADAVTPPPQTKLADVPPLVQVALD